MDRTLLGWLIALLVTTLLIAGCGPAGTPTPEPTPTSPPATPIPVLPTPTPLPPPPTPTPIIIPTSPPTATTEMGKPSPTPVPTVVPEEVLMALVPAGPFTMGSDAGGQDEAPAQQVDLPAFRIDKFEVTNADFARFVAATGYQTAAEKAGSGSTWRSHVEGRENHPVVRASWNDAKAYCEWAGKRLPAEAEWEKAARGTDGRTYPWGKDYDAKKVNAKDSGIRGTTAVGSYDAGASPYGVFDMAGNVWEWTADWYQAYPGSTYRSAYYGEQFKVLRGGGWFETAELVRTSARNATSVTAANDDVGFRCAK